MSDVDRNPQTSTASGRPAGDLILVVDDEPAILRALSAALGARGYRVVSAATGEAAIQSVAVDEPAAVILDLGLPDVDGVEVCRRVRTWSEVPIIVLTAEDADFRKVEALDDGADDYVTKPFSTPELLARLRVALRHRRVELTPGARPGGAGGRKVAAGRGSAAVIDVGDLRVDHVRHRVEVAGEVVSLTPKEFAFLALLATHPGRVFTHRMILQEVWGPEYGTETQYLRVYASQIRKKLDDDPASPRLLTEPGVGYRLVDPSQPDG